MNGSVPDEILAPSELYQPLSQALAAGPWDAIIIGSGIGGMSCAAALAKYGKRCLLLEKHSVPGGFTHTFSRRGYTWDVGVHNVGEMGENDGPGRILSWLSDGQLKWQHCGGVYERFFFPDGFEIEFSSDFGSFRATLERKFPQDKDSIDRYFGAVKEAIREAKPFFAFRALPAWIAGPGRRIVRMTNRTNYGAKTTAEVLEPIVPNSKLRAVLTGQWRYCGSPPAESSFAIHAMVVRHYMHGGYYPVGGAKSIADTLLKTVQSAGGATVVCAAVEKILIRGGRAVGVKTSQGPVILARRIISAAGANITVNRLLPADCSDSGWACGVNALKPSPAHVCLHLGLEGDLRGAGGTAANQWYMESWNTDQGFWDVEDPNSVAPGLYMSFPSLKDPHHVPGPSQRHTAEVVTLVPWAAFRKWEDTSSGNRPADYLAFKKKLEERLVAQLERHVPGVLAITKYRELSTPLSTVHFTGATQGAIYGLEATPARFTSPHLCTRTPIRGLFLAGCDVTMMGVTGALVGGVLAAATIDPRVLKNIL